MNTKVATSSISLIGRALRLLGAREHSRAELERKLARFAEEPGALTRVLDTLQSKDFINHARVVESVVNRRAEKLGTARIRQELQAKGLEPETMSQAMAQLRASEIARAHAVWRKKFGKAPQDTTERGKQMRFLASRGFDGEAIHRVVSGAAED